MKHTSKLMPYLSILLMAAIAYTTGTILAKIGALPQSNNTLFSLSAGNNSIQPQLYIIYLLISTIILVLVFRYKREWMAKVFTHMNFFMGYEITIAMFVLCIYIGGIFLPPIPLYIISIAIAIISVILWLKVKALHNTFTVLLGIAAIAVLANAFSTFWLLVIFALMSAWDLIAVFKLKFMQALAGMAINGDGKRMYPLFLYSGTRADLEGKLKGSKEVRNVALLGLGDIIIPGAFVASAIVYLKTPAFPILSVLLIGLTLDMYIARRFNRAIPALPILFAISLIAVILL